MNELEKRSFIKFLSLYLISTFLLVIFTAYWYYSSQKENLKSLDYFHLEHVVDSVAGEIIIAHMSGKSLKSIDINLPKDVNLTLVNTKEQKDLQTGVFYKDGYTTIISDAPREHLNIKYITAKSNKLSLQINSLKTKVILTVVLVLVLISLIAWRLSLNFLEPMRERIKQIQSFINDITHELNTPITSLLMSSKLLKESKKPNPKQLDAITISTNQLHDIYRSLTYLNFSVEEKEESIDLKEILTQSLNFYTQLASKKKILFQTKLDSLNFTISKTKATLLFNNLISNAIKYSHPNSTIYITLTNSYFEIKDEGIGIDKKEQNKIFEKYKRATNSSGGFGIGLNIVKKICDEYHIKIELESKKGVGSRFRLRFYEN